MKNKLVFAGLLIAVLAIGFIAVGCASTPKEPPYQFDGTTWTKTEEYELRFNSSSPQIEVYCGSERIFMRTGTINADGSVVYSNGESDLNVFTVNGNMLTCNRLRGQGYSAHAVGVWTLKSGTSGTPNSLAGTRWTRTAVLELSFADGKLTVKDGTETVDENCPYTATSKNFSVKLPYYSSSTRGTYVVDGNTLTFKNSTQGYVFGATRLEGSPWTKK